MDFSPHTPLLHPDTDTNTDTDAETDTATAKPSHRFIFNSVSLFLCPRSSGKSSSSSPSSLLSSSSRSTVPPSCRDFRRLRYTRDSGSGRRHDVSFGCGGWYSDTHTHTHAHAHAHAHLDGGPSTWENESDEAGAGSPPAWFPLSCRDSLRVRSSRTYAKNEQEPGCDSGSVGLLFGEGLESVVGVDAGGHMQYVGGEGSVRARVKVRVRLPNGRDYKRLSTGSGR